jgi:hypothetical protein
MSQIQISDWPHQVHDGRHPAESASSIFTKFALAIEHCNAHNCPAAAGQFARATITEIEFGANPEVEVSAL